MGILGKIGKVIKFIRVRGRIIPIRAKDGVKAGSDLGKVSSIVGKTPKPGGLSSKLPGGKPSSVTSLDMFKTKKKQEYIKGLADKIEKAGPGASITYDGPSKFGLKKGTTFRVPTQGEINIQKRRAFIRKRREQDILTAAALSSLLATPGAYFANKQIHKNKEEINLLKKRKN